MGRRASPDRSLMVPNGDRAYKPTSSVQFRWQFCLKCTNSPRFQAGVLFLVAVSFISDLGRISVNDRSIRGWAMRRSYFNSCVNQRDLPSNSCCFSWVSTRSTATFRRKSSSSQSSSSEVAAVLAIDSRAA